MTNRINKIFSIKTLIFMVIIAGIVFRVDHYLENRSLRQDEAALANDVIRRSADDILLYKNVNFHAPSAPIGFLLTTKHIVTKVVNNEYSFRFVPFIAGLLSIVLFNLVLKAHYGYSVVHLIAIALFSACNVHIFYSADFKPFSLDVLVAVLCLFIVGRLKVDKRIYKIIYLWGFGMVSLVFSYTSVFVLAGGYVSLMVRYISKRSKAWILSLTVVGLSWAAWLYCIYVFTLRAIRQKGIVHNMWSSTFFSKSSGIIEYFVWLKNSFINVFIDPLGFKLPLIAVLLFFIGCFFCAKKDKNKAIHLLLPLLLLILVASFGEYPIAGRVVLFLMPYFVMLIAEGAGAVIGVSRKAKGFVAVIVIAVLMYGNLDLVVYYLVNNREGQDFRKVMKFYKENRKKGDRLLVNNNGQYAFSYYSGYFGLEEKNIYLMKAIDEVRHDKKGDYVIYGYETFYPTSEGYFVMTRFEKARTIYFLYEGSSMLPGRMWVLLSETRPAFKEFLIRNLSGSGELLKFIEVKGSSAYLFELKDQR